MLSNVAFASRNIFSKLTMGDFKKEKTLSPQNIYGIMSIMALLIELPFALSIEGLPALPSAHIGKLLLGSGVFYTLYNTVSFMALGKTGVVTHAVGNILKRASVIIVSILVFRNASQTTEWSRYGRGTVGNMSIFACEAAFLGEEEGICIEAKLFRRGMSPQVSYNQVVFFNNYGRFYDLLLSNFLFVVE